MIGPWIVQVDNLHNIYLYWIFSCLMSSPHTPDLTPPPPPPHSPLLPPAVHVLLWQRPESLPTTNFWRGGGRLTSSNRINFCVRSPFPWLCPNGYRPSREFWCFGVSQRKMVRVWEGVEKVQWIWYATARDIWPPIFSPAAARDIRDPLYLTPPLQYGEF